MKKIIVRSKNGVVTVSTEGFSGPSCLKADEFIRNALGETIFEQLTKEYYYSTQEEEEKCLTNYKAYCG